MTDKNKDIRSITVQMLRKFGKYISFIRENEGIYSQAHKDLTSLGTLYLTDLPLKQCWGDDWDDSPSIGNAGQPYDEFNVSEFELSTDRKIYTEHDIRAIISDVVRMVKTDKVYIVKNLWDGKIVGVYSNEEYVKYEKCSCVGYSYEEHEVKDYKLHG